MTVPVQAQRHQAERAVQAATTAAAVRAVWGSVDPDQLEASWLRAAPLAADLIRAGQLAAAASAEEWLTGEAGPGRAAVDPRAAVAATGDLTGPLLYPLLIAFNRLRRGLSVAASILSGAAFLEMVTRSLVADAGRIADMAGMIARPRVVSYVRVVHLPACARCLILAGREYSLSEGFVRHPRCDCTMAPRRPGDTWELPSPASLFEEMTEAQRLRAFGQAAMAAIADGADIAQVVNARRSMATVTRYGRQVQATREGTTRRGLYGARRAKFQKAAGVRFGEATRGRARAVTPRLMPEEIYRLADGDREQAIRLLERNGYLFADSGAAGSDGAPSAGRSGGAGGEATGGGRAGAGVPPVPPGAGRVPAAGGDEVPLMGDLLPAEGGSTDIGRLEAGIRALFAGDFAGFTVEVTRVRPSANRVMVTANVMRDGEQAGEIWRTFRRDAEGRLYATHNVLELEAPFRRRGFSNAVNAHLEDWYRRSGADRIELNAAEDNGGFVWALKGYDFVAADDAEGIADQLERRLAEDASWLDAHRDDDGTPEDEYEAREDAYADGAALLRRMRDEPFGSAGFPTASEIAALGRRPEHTPEDSWLGKRTLMGSVWNGVKYL
ncbi:hypothetical protein ABZX40_17920 [Streptomyces sp. NPDC004610]|uniref:VG15 protein n=1 Tax=unclassified Streptomyces TaxID=2593676 RepID=UPI0033BE7DF8